MSAPSQDSSGLLSAAALSLRVHIHELGFPLLLWEHFDEDLLTSHDLRELLPQTWMYREGPERVIGTTKWVSMFRVAGFLAVPTNIHKPTAHVHLFRGATEVRSRGMAWYLNREDADVMRHRHSQYGRTHTYVTTASPGDLLAIFIRPGDGMEVVLDPKTLEDVSVLNS